MADISTGWRVKDWRLGDPNANDLGSPWAQVGHDVDWPGYVFTVRFDGKLGVSGFDVDCKASGPLTAARLRKVPLGEIAATARTYMAAWWAEFDKGRTPEAHNAWPLPKVLSPQVDMRRRGRRGRPDSELAEIAAAYVRCCAEHPTRPMVALAKERGLDPSQLRGLLNQARNWNRGLLTEAPDGRAGGMLTDKAKALIPIRNAWNLATPEQRRAAVELKRRRAPLDTALREGQVTEAEYREAFDRLHELPTDLLLRPPTREQVDADLARLAAVPARR